MRIQKRHLDRLCIGIEVKAHSCLLIDVVRDALRYYLRLIRGKASRSESSLLVLVGPDAAFYNTLENFFGYSHCSSSYIKWTLGLMFNISATASETNIP